MSKIPLVKQLVIGLPRTGKTTFIGALGHVVESGEVPGSLQLVDMGNEREHVNATSKDWSGYREVVRTNFNTEKIVVMKLKTPDGQHVTEILFPDMTGESFERQWKHREWTQEYDDLAREATGILLFVHPDKIVEPLGINAVRQLESQISEADGKPVPAESIDTAPQIIKWSLDLVPTGVQLVELLQFFTTQPNIYPLARIAVIISAWDRVADIYSDPNEWLSASIPLVDQFLKAGRNRVPFRVYGISAVGGDLENAEDLERMQNCECSSDRIEVVGEDCIPHDITAPIKWLMGI
jgi:hypothetical protein